VEISRQNARSYAADGDSLVSLFINAFGWSFGVATLGALVAAAAALGVARRRGDATCLTWTLIAALLASPIVWTHYYTLLFVPIALLGSPIAWVLPYLTVPSAQAETNAVEAVIDPACGLVLLLLVGGMALLRNDNRARVEDEPLG
jgi:ABC-type glycerol-3-phosphate transport system permease component